MTDNDRDLQLIDRLRSGQRDALGELYDRYSPLMFGMALRILRNRAEAEDALQEAWVQVWKTAGSFDSSRGPVGAWLVTIMRTRSLDRVRRVSSRSRMQEALEADPPTPPTDLRDEVNKIGVRDQVNAALQSLDPKMRQVIEIAYFEGLSQSEIAERLQTPLGTVKFWTRQGLLKLRESLGQGEWA